MHTVNNRRMRLIVRILWWLNGNIHQEILVAFVVFGVTCLEHFLYVASAAKSKCQRTIAKALDRSVATSQYSFWPICSQ